jgi:hypothetical protein
MSRPDSKKQGIDNLLNLDGYTIEVGGGYWTSASITLVQPDKGRPHGIQYALTMHAPGGARILGYDNAHAPPQLRSGPGRRKATAAVFDHVHRGEKVVPYEFRSPGDLLIDFWTDVEAILTKEGVQ